MIVYIHKRKADGTPFYIGMGSAKRANGAGARNKDWRKVAKLGYTVEIVADNLSREDAHKKEKELIEHYGRVANGGILVNGKGGDCGRRQIEDSEKMVQTYFFVQQKHIDILGKDKAKPIAANAVINEAQKAG